MRKEWIVGTLLTGACATNPPPAAVAPVAAVEAPASAEAVPTPASAPAPIAYPATRTVDQVDNQFGVAVADPYRWLENDVRNDPEVASWVDSENKVTHELLRPLALSHPPVTTRSARPTPGRALLLGLVASGRRYV